MNWHMNWHHRIVSRVGWLGVVIGLGCGEPAPESRLEGQATQHRSAGVAAPSSVAVAETHPAGQGDSGVDGSGDPFATCVALRGNGHYLFAHFGALARLVEDFSEVEAFAGGSSAAVTAFLYQSMRLNPSLSGDTLRRRQQLGILLKSVIGYAAAVQRQVDQAVTAAEDLVPGPANPRSVAGAGKRNDPGSQRALWSPHLQPVLDHLARALSDKTDRQRTATAVRDALSTWLRTLTPPAGHPHLAGVKLSSTIADQLRQLAKRPLDRPARRALLTASDMVRLVNPHLLGMLLDPTGYGYPPGSQPAIVADLQRAIATVGNFQGTDRAILLREGIVSFDGLAWHVGRAGDFYAETDFRGVFHACGGFDGGALARWEGRQTQGCREEFAQLADRFLTHQAGKRPRRLDDAVGGRAPLISLTAILGSADGDHHAGRRIVLRYRRALRIYRRHIDRVGGALPPTVERALASFAGDFDNVQFGVLVPTGDARFDQLRRFLTPPRRPSRTDAKVAKYRILSDLAARAGHGGGALKWRTVLAFSPLEPGLARLQYPSGADPFRARRHPPYAVIGGWADLAPVQLLRGAGCANVVYINRRGPESRFIVQDSPIGKRPARGVAELFGLKEAERRALYASPLEPAVVADHAGQPGPPSSYERDLTEADAVWCSDWDYPRGTEGLAFARSLMAQAYGSEPSARGLMSRLVVRPRVVSRSLGARAQATTPFAVYGTGRAQQSLVTAGWQELPFGCRPAVGWRLRRAYP